jgi:hypothetical protein
MRRKGAFISGVSQDDGQQKRPSKITDFGFVLEVSLFKTDMLLTNAYILEIKMSFVFPNVAQFHSKESQMSFFFSCFKERSLRCASKEMRVLKITNNCARIV